VTEPRRRRVWRRLDPGALAAAAWTLLVLPSVRRQVEANPLAALRIVRPPPLPGRARYSVLSVLRRRKATCLVQAAVLQRWDAARGIRRDLVIGVTAPDEEFKAHAWLEGDLTTSHDSYTELVRYEAPPTRRLSARSVLGKGGHQ
jgi:hypothetical protein